MCDYHYKYMLEEKDQKRELLSKVLQDLQNLEEKLHKDIREGDVFFGDSYICGVAHDIYHIKNNILEDNKRIKTEIKKALEHLDGLDHLMTGNGGMFLALARNILEKI